MKPKRPRIEPRFTMQNLTTVASSDPRMAEIFGAAPNPSGMHVNEHTAMSVSAAYACTRLIAGAIGSMPVDVFRRQPGGMRERINERHDMWWLLNEQAHTRWTAASMWKWLVKSELLRGDGFAWIQRDRAGMVTGLQPLWSDGVTVERRGDRLAYFFVDDDGRNRGADQDDILHVPGFGYDGMRGMSAIKWGARNAIAIGMATDDFSSRFFGSGAMVRHVLTTPGKMTKAAVDDLRAQFEAKYAGLENAYRPMVLTEGMGVSELSLNAEDSQLLESRKFQVIEVARAFGVPPFMIGESEKNTSFGAGIEQLSLGFVKYTLQDRLTTMEQEINRKLFRTASVFVKFNLDEMLRGDSAARAKFLREMVGGSQGPGIMTADEARLSEGYPALGGDAGKLYDPRSAQPAAAPAPAKGNPADA
jgi:HK97 family phage portal protein